MLSLFTRVLWLLKLSKNSKVIAVIPQAKFMEKLRRNEKEKRNENKKIWRETKAKKGRRQFR